MLLRVIENGLLVYSPHTALDAVTGGVNDWLAAAFPFTSKRAILAHPVTTSHEAIGQGRLLGLGEAIGLDEAIRRLKSHLGVDTLRVAAASGAGAVPDISSIALAAGAGGGVVAKVPADLYVTGEMRHHDVLQAVQCGTSVLLSEHTNTERGYLPLLRDQLVGMSGLSVQVSREDASPLLPV
jgi:putative NIF3 family GTP cyclohydrolase 1 type 2